MFSAGQAFWLSLLSGAKVAHGRKTPLRRKSPPGGRQCGCRRRDLVTEPAKSFEVMVDGALNRFGVSRLAELDETVPLVQDFPDDDAYPVSDGPDRLDVTKADDEALEDGLQVAPVRSGGGLGSLREQS